MELRYLPRRRLYQLRGVGAGAGGIGEGAGGLQAASLLVEPRGGAAAELPLLLLAFCENIADLVDQSSHVRKCRSRSLPVRLLA